MKRYIVNIIAIIGILMAYGMAFMPISTVEADNPQDIVSMRTENSKTTYLGTVNGKNKYALDSSLAPIHYKDNYSNPNEQWKNIDTTIVNSRIDKAPYTAVFDYANKSVTITDKKTGSITTIGMQSLGTTSLSGKGSPIASGNTVTWSNIATDTDIKIIAENSVIRFQRILKSDKADTRATFGINQIGSGIKLDYQGKDNLDTKLSVTATVSNGILIEDIDKSKIGSIKYPLVIDPSIDISISASSDDCGISNTSISLTSYDYICGESGGVRFSSGLRFNNITIPSGATILSSHITGRNSGNNGINANCSINGEDSDNAVTYSTYANWAARPLTSNITWSVPSMAGGTLYDTPSLNSAITTIISRAGWASGNSMAFQFRDNGSAIGTYRFFNSYDDSPAFSPSLYIEYAILTSPTITTNSATSVTLSTARLQSTLTDDGGASCQVRWGWGTVNQGTNITAYTNYTAYAGAWVTGSNPYYDISSLAQNTTYYFNVQAYNGLYTGNGTAISFTTGSNITAPSNVLAIPTINSTILLSWLNAASTPKVNIRWGENFAPTSNTTGTLLYNGSLTTYSHTGLNQGSTYYYFLQGYDDALGFSADNVTVQATVASSTNGTFSLTRPTEPSWWSLTPSPSAYITTSMWYLPVSNFARSFGFSLTWILFMGAMGICTLIGYATYRLTHQTEASVIMIAVAMFMGSLSGLIPGMMTAIVVIIAIGIIVLKQRSIV